MQHECKNLIDKNKQRMETIWVEEIEEPVMCIFKDTSCTAADVEEYCRLLTQQAESEIKSRVASVINRSVLDMIRAAKEELLTIASVKLSFIKLALDTEPEEVNLTLVGFCHVLMMR